MHHTGDRNDTFPTLPDDTFPALPDDTCPALPDDPYPALRDDASPALPDDASPPTPAVSGRSRRGRWTDRTTNGCTRSRPGCTARIPASPRPSGTAAPAGHASTGTPGPGCCSS